ncbi:MAG: DUF2339 domain-containing protein [Candidatus Zixiibacteriota bacterium]
MESQDDHNIHDRVAALERELAEIRQLLRRIVPDAAPPAPPPPSPAETTSTPRQITPIPGPARKGFELPEHMRRSEYWLSRVGIGLLLFGLAFLFKYSIDQGWLTPPVRHFIGIGLGVVLFVFGWRLYSQRRHLSRLLLGGSIATFYITDFSAFQLFELVSHPVAFALMVTVTALAFFIALKQDDAIFSLVGTLGGLGTPFMLYTGSANIPGLVVYTCLVIAGSTAVYFYRGWRLLLWLSAIGGWLVISISIDSVATVPEHAEPAARWALQFGVLFLWLGYSATPLLRRYLVVLKPNRWRAAELGIGDTVISETARRALDSHLHVFAVGSPLIGLLASVMTWPHLSDQTFGWITLAAAALYGFVSSYLRKLETLAFAAFTHAVCAALLLTISLSMLLDGNTLMLAWAGEALALHLLAQRLTDSKILAGAHVMSVIVGFWLMMHLLARDSERPVVFNRLAFSDLVVIFAGAAISYQFTSRQLKMIYGLAAHLALLAWLGRELSGLEDGTGYVTIAWGVYGAILLVTSLRLNSNALRWIALGTLLLVVAKLFLIDLSELETIWRVLLFMGFGAVFLLLSYYFPKLWKPK